MSDPVGELKRELLAAAERQQHYAVPARTSRRRWLERSDVRQGGRRRLVVLAAAVLVVVVGAASAFATVHVLFGGEPHVQRGFFPSEGKRGTFTVRILFMRDAEDGRKRSWRIIPEPGRSGDLSGPVTGQYVQVTGRGRIARIGGKAQAWSARLEGFVTRPGEAKQRIVITMKGRPEGVFVLTPLEPGVLKRDSGTHERTGATG